MTVNELIERLKSMNGNLKVFYSDVQHGAPDMEINDVSKGESIEGEDVVYLWKE